MEKKIKLEEIDCTVCMGPLQGIGLTCMNCFNSVCFAHRTELAKLECPTCRTKYPNDQLCSWSRLLAGVTPIDQIDFSNVEMPTQSTLETAMSTMRGFQILQRYLKSIPKSDWCLFVRDRAVKPPLAYSAPFWTFMMQEFRDLLVVASYFEDSVLDILYDAPVEIAKTIKPLVQESHRLLATYARTWLGEGLDRYKAMCEIMERKYHSNDFYYQDVKLLTKEKIEFLLENDMRNCAESCAGRILNCDYLANEGDDFLRLLLPLRPLGWVYDQRPDTNPLLEEYRPVGIFKEDSLRWVSQHDFNLFGIEASSSLSSRDICYKASIHLSAKPVRHTDIVIVLFFDGKPHVYTSRMDVAYNMLVSKQYANLKKKLAGRRVTNGTIHFQSFHVYYFDKEFEPF